MTAFGNDFKDANRTENTTQRRPGKHWQIAPTWRMSHLLSAGSNVVMAPHGSRHITTGRLMCPGLTSNQNGKKYHLILTCSLRMALLWAEVTRPMENTLDVCSLLKDVQSRVKPRLHVFGHIHEGRGVSYDGTTLYINASNVSHNYTRHHPSIVVDLPHDTSLPAQLVTPDCRLDADALIVWLRQNGYERTANKFEKLDDRFAGSDLVDRSYDELCCRLLIHRDEEAKVELKQAIAKLWLECFEWSHSRLQFIVVCIDL